MAHGTPDYGGGAPKKTVYALPDMGELAVRLGSPISHDRRGDVIFLDTFEDGLGAWAKTEQGTGASAEWSAERSLFSGFSAKLIAGSDGSHHTSIQHMSAYPVLGKMGFEFSIAQSGHLDYIILYADLYDGVDTISGALSYDNAADTIKVLGAGLAWTAFVTNFVLYGSDQLFHVIKMVVDFDAQKYVRAIVDDVEYDLSAYTPYSAASADGPNVRMRPDFFGRNGENDVAYIGHCIITQNEP